jgi:ABC-2 type transport system ATP-binding protein
MNPILELRGVRKAYGSFVAVEGLDLQVPRGVVYGVLGPNGAGKSTTIRMIMNIYLPDHGQILFDGRPLDRSATDRIAYLPEERGLYRKMRVREHIVYLAELKGMDRREATAKADRWLERFGLSDRALGKVNELSKGMQQKLQFIACVLPEPELIILDEPFSGLDPLNVRLLTEIIDELRQSGKTVLFSTHVLEQAEKLSDCIFLIHRGRKVLDGRLDEIQSSYPVDTIVLECSLSPDEVGALPDVEHVEQKGTEIRVRLHDGAGHQELLREILRRGQVKRFAAARPPLTEIFLREVQRSGVEIDEAERHSTEGVSV